MDRTTPLRTMSKSEWWLRLATTTTNLIVRECRNYFNVKSRMIIFFLCASIENKYVTFPNHGLVIMNGLFFLSQMRPIAENFNSANVFKSPSIVFNVHCSHTMELPCKCIVCRTRIWSRQNAWRLYCIDSHSMVRVHINIYCVHVTYERLVNGSKVYCFHIAAAYRRPFENLQNRIDGYRAFIFYRRSSMVIVDIKFYRFLRLSHETYYQRTTGFSV